MRLWELEEGDGDAEDLWRDRQARELQIPDEDEHEQEIEVVPPPPQPQQQQAVPAAPANPNAPALEREGPLILRINQLPPRPVPAAAPAPEPRRQNRQAQNGRGGRRRAPRFDERGEPMFEGAAGADGDDEEARQRWVQMFVQMALNDEEDLVEWEDGEEDHARWEIPVGR